MALRDPNRGGLLPAAHNFPELAVVPEISGKKINDALARESPVSGRSTGGGLGFFGFLIGKPWLAEFPYLMVC